LLRATITKSNAIAASMSRSYPLTSKNVCAAAKATRLFPSRIRMLVDDRLHQRGSLFQNTRVIPDLRTKDRGLQRRLVLYPWVAAVLLDLLTMNAQNFRDRKVNALGHLFGQLRVELPNFSFER